MKPTTLKQALNRKLPSKELSLVKRAFDQIGDIAILEIPDSLKKKEKIIAETLLTLHPHLKVVCKKASKHSGVFRLQKVKILAGEKRKETEYRENNIRLKLNIEKCYFSPRLATERLRITNQIKKGESILVMFSGIGPYPLGFSKNASPKDITAIEINPTAHKYALANKRLNKDTKVMFLKGDVKKVVPRIKKKFDRILMPLPKGAENFLHLIWKVSKKGTIVHFYDFEEELNIKKARKKVIEAAKKAKKKIKIKKVVKCGQYGPRKFRLCLDFNIQ